MFYALRVVAITPLWLASAGGAVAVWAGYAVVDAVRRRSLVVLPRSPAAAVD